MLTHTCDAYTHTHTQAHTHIHTHMHTDKHTWVCTYIHKTAVHSENRYTCGSVCSSLSLNKDMLQFRLLFTPKTDIPVG